MTCSISLTSLYLSPTSPDWRMIVDFELIPVSPCKQTSFFVFFFHDVFMTSGKTENGCHSELQWSGLVFNPSSCLGWFITSLVFRAWSIWAGWDCSKTCQRECRNLRPSTIREACTKPGRSASTYERSFSKWGRSRQRSSSFFFSRLMDVKTSRITDAWTVTFAAPWRYQRRWGSTWRPQPLITGMTAKSVKKKKKGSLCLFYLWHNDSAVACKPYLTCIQARNNLHSTTGPQLEAWSRI